MRIENSSDLQFSAFLVVRHEAFIPSAIATILVIGGITAALFATRVPLSISISVSAGLLLSYAVVMLALFILRNQYLDNQESVNASTDDQIDRFSQSILSPKDYEAWKINRSEEKKHPLKQEPKQEEARQNQITEEERYLIWLNEHKNEISIFISESIEKIFGDVSKYQKLNSMDYKPKAGTMKPEALPAASMVSSVMVLNYTLPTGQKIPFFAVKFLDMSKINGTSKNGPLTFTAFLYPAFCFPQNSIGGLKMEWEWTREQGWNTKGKKEKERSNNWLQGNQRLEIDKGTCPGLINLINGTFKGYELV